jgi:hypothetical protein
VELVGIQVPEVLFVNWKSQQVFFLIKGPRSAGLLDSKSQTVHFLNFKGQELHFFDSQGPRSAVFEFLEPRSAHDVFDFRAKKCIFKISRAKKCGCFDSRGQEV